MTTPETKAINFSGAKETLLVTLHLRAMESQRPDALIKDERAVELVKKLNYDFNRIKLLHLSEANKVSIILRNREFDCYVRDFLARHPNAVVVHIGCGLDSRFERVDNGQVEWYDLDLPEVIELRRSLLGDEKERYHLLACSVLDDVWLKVVSKHHERPFLFLAEGVSMYLKEAEMKSLVTMLHKNFRGTELVFDAYSPLHVLRSNLQTSTFGFRCHWGVWHGKKLERWGKGIKLIDEWGFFDAPESRLAYIRWMRPIEALARTLRIYHYQLGEKG
jgi:O-methyltransferase involved in polyketide biosynthesis